jgi:hypothetical protein
MAKRSQHSYKKWQREVKRKQKAEEKMARRQGKKTEADDFESSEPAVEIVEVQKGDEE